MSANESWMNVTTLTMIALGDGPAMVATGDDCAGRRERECEQAPYEHYMDGLE